MPDTNGVNSFVAEMCRIVRPKGTKLIASRRYSTGDLSEACRHAGFVPEAADEVAQS